MILQPATNDADYEKFSTDVNRSHVTVRPMGFLCAGERRIGTPADAWEERCIMLGCGKRNLRQKKTSCLVSNWERVVCAPLFDMLYG